MLSPILALSLLQAQPVCVQWPGPRSTQCASLTCRWAAAPHLCWEHCVPAPCRPSADPWRVAWADRLGGWVHTHSL